MFCSFSFSFFVFFMNISFVTNDCHLGQTFSACYASVMLLYNELPTPQYVTMQQFEFEYECVCIHVCVYVCICVCEYVFSGSKNVCIDCILLRLHCSMFMIKLGKIEIKKTKCIQIHISAMRITYEHNIL